MKLKTTNKSEEENVYDLLSAKSENVFHKETKPGDIEGGGFCIRLHIILLGAGQGIDERHGK